VHDPRISKRISGKGHHKATHGQGEADPSATSRVANPASQATQAWGAGNSPTPPPPRSGAAALVPRLTRGGRGKGKGWELELGVRFTRATQAWGAVPWPLHDIVVTNIVWCIAYTREIEGESYTAQCSFISFAPGWAMQVGVGGCKDG